MKFVFFMTFAVLGALSTGHCLASSYDFNSADGLFSRRGEGFAVATTAREAYEKALLSQGLDQNDKIYAVSQMSRLDIYRGSMIPGVEDEVRREVLSNCVENVEALAQSKTQVYYHFRASCIGLRTKFGSNMIEKGIWALKLKNMQDAALHSTKVNGEFKGGFEGGGILRVYSGIKSRRSTRAIGLFDPKEALAMVEASLATESVQYRPFPEALSGADYFENFYYLAQAQLAVAADTNQKNLMLEGIETLASTLSTIKDLENVNQLPKGREPETRYYAGELAEMLNNANSCKDLNNWKQCLIDRLD
jgi:hypothetical protein